MFYEDADGIDLLTVNLNEENRVDQVAIEIYSRSYDNIYLSKEINPAISDLNLLVGKIKEDMTLKEVEAILGKGYFESEKRCLYTDEIRITYTWYDIKENRLEIDFEEGKVWLVYDVYEMY